MIKAGLVVCVAGTRVPYRYSSGGGDVRVSDACRVGAGTYGRCGKTSGEHVGNSVRHDEDGGLSER